MQVTLMEVFSTNGNRIKRHATPGW